MKVNLIILIILLITPSCHGEMVIDGEEGSLWLCSSGEGKMKINLKRNIEIPDEMRKNIISLDSTYFYYEGKIDYFPENDYIDIHTNDGKKTIYLKK